MNSRKFLIISLFLGALTALVAFLFISQKNNHEIKEINGEEKVLKIEETQSNIKEKKELSNDFFSISKGKRAMSIAVNEVQGVSGFLKKDDYVDVIVIIPPPQGENASSQVLLERVKVLSVGNPNSNVQIEENSENVQPKIINYATVTLEVSPQEGSALAFAAEKGKVLLMLRSKNDETKTEHTHITLEQLNKGMIFE